MSMSTPNSKHAWKYLPERENTHVNVQSCPSNPKKEIKMLDLRYK